VIILLAAITLINFSAAVQGYRAGTREAEQTFDRQLSDEAAIIAGAESFDLREIDPIPSNALIYQIWSRSRELLEYSTDAPDQPIAKFEQGFDYSNFNSYRWRTYSLYDARHERWILVAHRMDIRYAMADSIIIESILPIVIGIPIAGLIIWLIVGSGLTPLRRLANQLQQKHVEDLSPVNLANPPQELRQVLQSTNQLLQRLSDSVTREKRFASDAAHELRTPISTLKIHLHNLQHEYPEITTHTADFKLSLDRLEHLVDQILALYRCAPDQYIAKFETIDLLEAAQDVIAQHYQMLEQRDQSIELLGESIAIKGNPFAISTLIQNLLSNASKYSPEGGDIRITVGTEKRRPFLRLEDSGPGIAEAERIRVYERFYRISKENDTDGISGSGLGLSIVKNITQQHHAEIVLGASSYSSGLAVTVKFPGVENQ
jgi:two-component system sensor histidine kinase QseC